jgi:hypothetical protein
MIVVSGRLRWSMLIRRKTRKTDIVLVTPGNLSFKPDPRTAMIR